MLESAAQPCFERHAPKGDRPLLLRDCSDRPWIVYLISEPWLFERAPGNKRQREAEHDVQKRRETSHQESTTARQR